MTVHTRSSVHPFFQRKTEAPPIQEGPLKWLVDFDHTCLHGVHLDPPSRPKVAAFDLDSTVIRTKSRSKWAESHEDWTWWKPIDVPAALVRLHDDGYVTLLSTVRPMCSQRFYYETSYSIVLVSNQGRPASLKAVEAKAKFVKEWKQKIALIAAAVCLDESLKQAAPLTQASDT